MYHCKVNRLKLLKITLPEKINNAISVLLSKLINGKKDLKRIGVKKILCIKTDEIGDLCYSLHVFEMLKHQYPLAELTLICKPYAITLTHNNPFIDHITSNWNDLTGRYDLIVDLRVTRRSLLYALMHWPKIRLDRGTIRLKNKRKGKHPHESVTNMEIVAPLIDEKNRNTIPKLYKGAEEIKKVEQFIIDNGIKRFAILHPGARKKLRRWDKFPELAGWLKRVKGFDIVFTGDHYERELVASAQQLIPFKTHSIAGIFNLAELAVLCSEAAVYIGNESGPLHIASVMGTPSLGLYGPGEPEIFYPLGKKTDYIHYVLECNPCDQKTCVHPDNPCMKRIQLTEVTTKIETLLI